MADNTKVKVKGLNGRSTRPMSYDHVSTLDFNVVKPFGIWELVPSDHIKVTPEMWMRTQNLACPTFGKVDCITRAFFVPHRLVMQHFLDMWSKTPFRASSTSNSLVTLDSVFKIENKMISDIFVSRFTGDSEHFENSEVHPEHWNGDGASVQSLTFGIWRQNSSWTDDFSDFETYEGAMTTHYRFNPIGKRVWDLFYSLGYRFALYNISGTAQDNKNSGSLSNYYDCSLLPILSYLKIFSDWYCPSEFKYLFNVDEFAHHNGDFVSEQMVQQIFDMVTYAVYMWYNDDMFSLCEHFPYSKQNFMSGGPFGVKVRQPYLQEGDILQWDIARGSEVSTDLTGAHVSVYGSSGSTSSGSTSYVTVNGQDFVGNTVGTAGNAKAKGSPAFGNLAWNLNESISSFTVRAVQKAANWLQKNNLLTHRATDYLRAKFGVEPNAVRLDVSEYIGSASAPVKISDVVSTEASDGKLGELGGKGTSYSIQELNYTAEEFGYFIVTVELRPRIQYGQGVNPLILRCNHEDFWQEELDGLGFTPVPTECLCAGPISTNRVNQTYRGVVFNLGDQENRVFGYLPTFWSYKINHGNLSGDFMIPKNLDIQSYHLMRTVPGQHLDDYVHNSLKFRYPGLCFYENEYNRIFMNPDTLTLRDHFQLIGSFDCYINGPVLALSESWQVNPDGEERQGREQHIQSVL